MRCLSLSLRQAFSVLSCSPVGMAMGRDRGSTRWVAHDFKVFDRPLPMRLDDVGGRVVDCWFMDCKVKKYIVIEWIKGKYRGVYRQIRALISTLYICPADSQVIWNSTASREFWLALLLIVCLYASVIVLWRRVHRRLGGFRRLAGGTSSGDDQRTLFILPFSLLYSCM